MHSKFQHRFHTHIAAHDPNARVECDPCHQHVGWKFRTVILGGSYIIRGRLCELAIFAFTSDDLVTSYNLTFIPIALPTIGVDWEYLYLMEKMPIPQLPGVQHVHDQTILKN